MCDYPATKILPINAVNHSSKPWLTDNSLFFTTENNELYFQYQSEILISRHSDTESLGIDSGHEEFPFNRKRPPVEPDSGSAVTHRNKLGVRTGHRQKTRTR